MNNWGLLSGAVDELTAYTVNDYPYGSLRTSCRWWIETATKGGGKGQQRVAKQTLNPKTGRWNKPHYGIYSPMVVLYIDRANGHCENYAISLYSLFDVAKYIGTGLAAQHDGPQAQRFLSICRAIRRMSARFGGESHVESFDLALSAARAEPMTTSLLEAMFPKLLYTNQAQSVLSMVEAERHCGERISTGEPVDEMAAV